MELEFDAVKRVVVQSCVRFLEFYCFSNVCIKNKLILSYVLKELEKKVFIKMFSVFQHKTNISFI